MAAGRLLIPGWMPALDEDGNPIPNARVFFYLNKTNTLAAVFSDEAMTVPLVNPVPSNASGRFPAIWADDAVLYSASVDAPYGPAGIPFTYDNLSASMAADILIAGAAEAAADEAQQTLVEIQGIIDAAMQAGGGEAAVAGAIAGAGAAQAVVANKADVDGGNTIPGDFRANILVSRTINAKELGAVGDGVADDTAALQAAIDAGPQVFLPPGTYRITDALSLRTGTQLFGVRGASTIKATSLATGGPGLGQRLLDGQGISNFSVRNLSLDIGTLSTHLSAARAISLTGCSHYVIADNDFLTCGAAVASIGCSFFWVKDNYVKSQNSGGSTYHDGLIDQWAGSNNFYVTNNIIDAGGTGKYSVLVTGTDTANLPSSCFNFEIYGNQITNSRWVAIWCNGRAGVNRDFSITNNRVNGVAEFFGIAVSDSERFNVRGNIIKDTARNGIRLYKEASVGTFSCKSAVMSDNTVINANVLEVTNQYEGSALAVGDESSGIEIATNIVQGSTHRWAVYLAPTVTNTEVIGSKYAPGLNGAVASTNPSNIIFGGVSYVPTLTGVANVASVVAGPTRYERRGQTVTVDGRLTVTPTAAANTTTTVGISLPVPRTLTDAGQVLGTGTGSFGVNGAISGDVANSRALFTFTAPNTGANTIVFRFQYVI